MEVVIRGTAEAAAELTAAIIAREIAANPHLVLGLATGRTMEAVYRILVRKHREEGLDFAGVTTFNLDEYVGVPGDHPASYRHYMNEHLFRHVNIDPARTFLPNGMAADIPTECRQYESRIRNRGGIGLQLLGIGRSGHIGFNEPLSALRSRTREKPLTPKTIEQNSPMFGGPEHMPRWAITMGVGTILDSQQCLLLATGAEKAEIIAKAVEGPITSMISATALQLHPHCTVIVDEAAAAKLEQADYYRWVFENERHWDGLR
ncbi:MAG TPA: glucosamine-6-phosphate deaminase [Candidatus Hydrogenedentes bacterium]|nr:glucosamine-6-phosphate deaminase [Candidatus Hydrogenedentota bacterium]HOV74048.1 glucosamine-6-phosphate deaminase [Candidatus Hydrogenedentota bacterium]